MTQKLIQLLQPYLDQRGANPGGDFSADEVRQWVDDLGRDKPFESLEALHNLLKGFNQTLLTQSPRFPLLELLRPVVDRSLPEVVASYHRLPWPVSIAAAELMIQVEEILNIFFIGYALSIIEEPSPSNIGRAIHRALDFGQRKMLENARRYQSADPRDGALIFALYEHARTLDCHVNPIEPWDAPEIEWDSARLTNEKQFLRLLILQLLQPSAWWPGDAADISYWVGQWMADLEGLSDTPPRKEHLYSVDLEHVAPPVMVDPPAKPKPAQPGIFYFSLDPLVARLRRFDPQAISTPATKSTTAASTGEKAVPEHIPPLARRLLSCFVPQADAAPEAQAWPAAAPTALTLVQGFEAVHQWLFFEGDAPKISSAKGPSLITQGAAIRMRAEQASGVQIGELMAWHDEPSAPPATWRLAEVVRMHLSEKDTMDVGLQFFAHDIQAGQIKPVVSDKGVTPPAQPCLLLLPVAVKGKAVGNGPLTLLTLPGLLALGMMYEVVLAEQIHLVELSELERQTAAYARWGAARIQSIRRDDIG